jgi:heme exporter protein A
MQLMVENLACVRGERTLFEGLSFALAPGQAALVTGPNGAGKTSLLRLIAGFLAPATGQIRFAGMESGHAAQESIHFVGHLDAVKGALSVFENLAFIRTLLAGSAMIESVLITFALRELAEFPARVLSAGQKRRLALARLILAERPLWLLDEPATGLDANGRKVLSTLIAAHRARGGLVVVATHGAPDLTGAREIRLGAGEGA